MKKVCSRCYKGIMHCDCENFNPPVLVGMDKHLAERLIQFFDSVGWISYEDYPDVHQFIKELNDFKDS